MNSFEIEREGGNRKIVNRQAPKKKILMANIAEMKICNLNQCTYFGRYLHFQQINFWGQELQIFNCFFLDTEMNKNVTIASGCNFSFLRVQYYLLEIFLLEESFSGKVDFSLQNEPK